MCVFTEHRNQCIYLIYKQTLTRKWRHHFKFSFQEELEQTWGLNSNQSVPWSSIVQRPERSSTDQMDPPRQPAAVKRRAAMFTETWRTQTSSHQKRKYSCRQRKQRERWRQSVLIPPPPKYSCLCSCSLNSKDLKPPPPKENKLNSNQLQWQEKVTMKY